MQIRLNADRLFRIHTGTIVALLGAYAAVNLISLGSGRPRMFGLVSLLDLNGERNIPAMFSFIALLAAGLLAGEVARRIQICGRRHAWRWMALAVVLGYMALDEALEWHEHIGWLLRAGHDLPGGWHYSWVLPYAALIAAVVVVCLPMLRSVPAPVRNSMILAGGIFVAGAAGMELVGGLLATYAPERVGLYRLSVLVEEGAEMLAIALLIRTMVRYADEFEPELPRARTAPQRASTAGRPLASSPDEIDCRGCESR
jgi:hypothetical protein